jgi:hypothetical protein
MDEGTNLSQVQHSERSSSSVSINDIDYELPQGWGIFVCSQKNMLNVWNKLNEFPILFDDVVRGNFVNFCEELINPTTVVLQTGDYGMVRVCNIVPHRNADVHLTFWDRRFKGRDKMCKEALRWMFSKFDLHRSTIVVPSIVHYTINFILALGFKREGVVREAYAYKGRLLDQHIFGLLNTELFNKEA